jgi:hypothetical protein
MNDKNRVYHRSLPLGCGFLASSLIIGLTLVVGLVIRQDLQAARYPGAAPVSDRSFYTLRYTFWNNVYLTPDPIEEVHNWYVNRLDMNLVDDQWVGEDCLLLNRLRRGFDIEQELGVLVCETPAGQEVYVTRSIALR